MTFNPFKLFFGKKINVPAETPPTIPAGKKVKQSEDGIYLTQYSFNTKWQIVEEKMRTTNLIVTVGFIALCIAFLTLYFDYQQFDANLNNEYLMNRLNLSEEKYNFQQRQLDFILGTDSAKFRP